MFYRKDHYWHIPFTSRWVSLTDFLNKLHIVVVEKDLWRLTVRRVPKAWEAVLKTPERVLKFHHPRRMFSSRRVAWERINERVQLTMLDQGPK